MGARGRCAAKRAGHAVAESEVAGKGEAADGADGDAGADVHSRPRAAAHTDAASGMVLETQATRDAPFCELSQRGMLASLWRQRSVAPQSTDTL